MWCIHFGDDTSHLLGMLYWNNLIYKGTFFMKNIHFWTFGILMGAIVVSANYLVQFPINDFLTWGAITFPICFLVTDLVNRFYGLAITRKMIFVGFVIGFGGTLFIAPVRIAVASLSAFLICQSLDAIVFDKLRQGMWWKAPVVSTLLAGFLDTFLFFALAFAGTGLPWITWILGDVAVKYAVSLLLVPIYGAFIYNFIVRKNAEKTA